MHAQKNDGGRGAVPAQIPTRASSSPFVWKDGRGRQWHVELGLDQIVLRHENEALELPKLSWERDLYVAPHGRGFIIRFSTFQTELGFVVSADEAVPFIEHVSRQLRADRAVEAAPSEPSRESLLWPKVSPLAVWALACASLTFLPLVGFIPAGISAVLLWLHGKRIQRSPAWAHSRALCKSAVVFLAVGLLVQGLATWSLMRPTLTDHSPPARHHLGSLHRGEASGAVPGTTAGPIDGSPGAFSPTAAFQAASGADRAAPATGIVDRDHNWGLVGAALLVVLMSLSVHEAAHAITAWWLGDDFARRLGRVTLNPLAHIDPFGTVLLPLLLALANVGVFGWARPVPVRTEVLPNPRRAHMLISIAGPASNLLMAAASLALLLGLGCAVELFAPQAVVSNYSGGRFFDTVSARGFVWAPVFAGACTMLKLSFMINLLLAFFNLIPIPPLDGSWVLGHLFPGTIGRLYQLIQPYSFLIFLVVLWSDVFLYLLLPATVVIVFSFELLGTCTRF